MEQGRWFFALAPKGLAENKQIIRVTQRLRRTAKDAGWDIKWAMADQLHVVIGYVGDVTEAQKSGLFTLGAMVAGQTSAFDMDLKGLGAFPEPEAGRVVWVGVRRTMALVELNDALVEGVDKMGLSPERESFVPHVTLGRLRHARHLGNWISPFKRQSFGEERVDRLELFRSHVFGAKVLFQREGQWDLI